MENFIYGRIIKEYNEKGLYSAIEKFYEYFNKSALQKYRDAVEDMIREGGYGEILK